MDKFWPGCMAQCMHHMWAPDQVQTGLPSKLALRKGSTVMFTCGLFLIRRHMQDPGGVFAPGYSKDSQLDLLPNTGSGGTQ